MAHNAPYLIIGGGLAAAKAVEGIREHDPSGAITVVTAEPHLPYEKPPLSKAVLQGKDAPDVVYPHPAGWYREQGVHLVLGDPAQAIDVPARTVRLRDGRELGYQRLLLATGSVPRRLHLPGSDLPGLHYLRSLDDSLQLLEQLRAGGRVVIVGAGWIGLEVAAAARAHGCPVTLLEPQPAPLLAVMGERIGRWFANLHTRHGVEVLLGTRVTGFAGNRVVTGVLTGDGETVEADTVAVGVGIRPDTTLAEAAGLAVDNGVVTDASLRTSVPGIWAAGDVASWYSTLLGRQLRVEHWANAHDGGLAAGRSMAGQDVRYDPVPFFFSDQYDIGLEYAGFGGPGAEVILRGDPATDAFMAFWVEPVADGVRVLAGMHVNTWGTIDAVQRLVRSREVVAREALADPRRALPGSS